MICTSASVTSGGILTANGEQLAEVKFDSVGVFHDGLAVVKAAERYGYIDRSGAIVIPIQWMAAYDSPKAWPHCVLTRSISNL